MASRQPDEEAIFHVARRIADLRARADYLDQICAGDLALRERVEALLGAHESRQFLKANPPPTEELRPLTERLGQQIGRYRLMEQIGEGGMGIVFVAEQERPIRRKVALKVIKAGMDSKAVLARFEAERQALAMMDHPNIAKVLDAGTTASGRPYFAMELVKGIQITEYCDKNRLTIRDRLALFVQVCQAIQHAHLKGIIHRDIKPSNVLVTLHDGQPVPKVIDFGVAKSLNARLTDNTIYTEHLQIIGTLLYMSPEQAEMSGLDVDTRSDVYSLGVLLYELLTGTTPLTPAELNKAGFDQQRRMICDQEPPRASVRISSLGETATTVAEHRRTDTKRLNHVVRGDLDWIVMKSLEKDRSRRYESASAFGADVARFLSDEEVHARPTSASYRLRKLVHKHVRLVASTTAIIASLILGLGIAAWALVQQRQVTIRLRSALGSYYRELEVHILDAALGGESDRAKMLLDEAGDVAAFPPSSREWLGALIALSEGHTKECITTLEGIRASDRTLSVAAQVTLASAYIEDGRLSEYYTTVEEIRHRTPITDADFLMFGEGIWGTDQTGEGVRRLQDAVARHDTPVIRAMCARAMMVTALVRSDSEMARQAVEHMTVAEIMSGDLPLVRDFAVVVHHGAMLFSAGVERQGHESRAAKAAATAAGSAQGALYRAQFYDHLGETSRARHFYIEGAQRGDVNAYYLAPFLFADSPQAALADFEMVPLRNPSGPGAMGAKAFLLALTPGRQAEAIALADRVTKRYTDFDTRIDALCASLLAGDRSVAEKARELRPSCYGDYRDFAKTLDYLADERGLVDLLSIAKTSMGDHVHYYALGVKLLSQGERKSAKQYLALSAESRQLFTSYPLYARAILKQMDRDASWPPWLPTEPHDVRE